MKTLIVLLFVMATPTAAFAGSRVIFQYGGSSSTNNKIPYQPPEPSAEERMRAIEEREINNNTPKEKALSAQDIENIINKMNNELLQKTNPNKAPKAEANTASGAFGTVGGIGAVGGAGIGNITTSSPK